MLCACAAQEGRCEPRVATEPRNVADGAEGPPTPGGRAPIPHLVLGSEVLDHEWSNEEPGILRRKGLMAQRPDCSTASLRGEVKEGGEGLRTGPKLGSGPLYYQGPAFRLCPLGSLRPSLLPGATAGAHVSHLQGERNPAPGLILSRGAHSPVGKV